MKRKIPRAQTGEVVSGAHAPPGSQGQGEVSDRAVSLQDQFALSSAYL